MEQRKVLVLTEASPEMGLGHINRALNVVSHFAYLGFDVTWIIRGRGQVKLDAFKDVSYEEWVDSNALDESIAHYDLVIVDVYEVEQPILNLIACRARRSLFIIDSALKYGYCETLNNDITVLFSSAYASKEMVPKSVRFLGGLEFLLFKDSFYNIDNQSTRQPYNEQVQNIVINIGGYYEIDLMNKILQAVDDVYQQTNIDILGIAKEEDILLYSSTKNNINSLFLSNDEYANRLLNADIVISNGGQSLNEALFLNRPCVAMCTASNQVRNIAFWEAKSVLNNVGEIAGVNFIEKLRSSLELLVDVENRRKLTPLEKVSFSRNSKNKIYRSLFN